MGDKRRVLLLVLVMAAACVAVAVGTFTVLYNAAFEEQRDTLTSLAWNYAKLIEAISRFDSVQSQDYPGGPLNATFSQIADAHRLFKGIGHTGEIVLAKRDGDKIVFLLSHRQKHMEAMQPIPLNSKLAEPMRRALSGHSGSMIALDYRGVMVLAAYEPVAGTHWGTVAKVDLSEVRDPFITAGVLALEIAIIVILIGAIFFLRITNPIIARLKSDAENLAKLVQSLQQSEDSLRKARDELEIRVEERTRELSNANKLLATEVDVRTRAEDRLRTLWNIAEMVDADAAELCNRILQATLQMTHSRYAFYGFLNADESVMSIYAWSGDVMDDCKTLEKPIQYPIARAGLWAEAVRKRCDLVVNDYDASHAGKRGLPEGHIKLTRLVTVPVLSRGRVVAIVAAANKETDYDDEDVKQLKAFASGVQMIIDQREMQQALRTSENECRLLSRQVIEAQESERKRYAREIHDAIGQSLAAIKYRVESNALALDKHGSAGNKEIQTIVQMIRETMEEVRRIQNDLRPVYLDVMGVVDTIADFCEKFQTTYTAIKIDRVISISEDDIPEPIKAPLFRIFQEAMNNAAKHSEGDRVEVRLRKAENIMELAVTDNGSGLDLSGGMAGNAHGRGLGLFSMEERAKLSGGSFEFQSSPGAGTSIRVKWPLNFAMKRSGKAPSGADFNI